MKKRLLASLLSLCLLVGLFPTAALAAEGTADEAAVVCMELEGCIGDAHDEDCPLYVAPNEDESNGEDDSADVPGEPDADPVYDNGDDTTVIDPEQEEPVQGPTPAEQLAELIADLPDPSEIDPLDEEQVEAVYNQISAIYAFAGENGFDDIYDNETINAVIAAAWPAEPLVDVTAITSDGGSLASGEYELTEDIKTTDLTIPANAEVTIDLNGHTLTGSGSSSVITVYGKLTLKDSKATGPQEIADTSNLPSEVYTAGSDGEDRTFTAKTITNSDGSYTTYYSVSGLDDDELATSYYSYTSGAVTGGIGQLNTYYDAVYSDNLTRYAGGGVYVAKGGSFVLEGGAITGNTANQTTTYANGSTSVTIDPVGAGIYAEGSFSMSGGVVSSNSTAGYGGGVYVDHGNFSMTGGAIAANTATKNGGGVFSESSTCTLSATISGNTSSSGYGGGLCAKSSTIKLSGGDISTNKSTHAGGVYANACTVEISNGFIVENQSNGNGGGVFSASTELKLFSGGISANKATQGGGIYATGSSGITMSGGVLTKNEVKNAGGGIYAGGSSTVVLSGGTISQNSAKNSGGGIYATGSNKVTLSGGTIGGTDENSANTAANGGGIYYDSGEITITGGTIGMNTATTNGGGIYAVNSSKIVLLNGDIANNSATGSGGGIFVSGSSAVEMTGGSVSGNNAGSAGGVYAAGNSKFSISGGTISDNTATNNGGGIFATGNSAFEISNGTISQNKASNGGGIYIGSNGSVKMSGGAISQNDVTGYGGGISVSGGTMLISENPIIFNNTKTKSGETTGEENNIYLPNSKYITLSGPLTGGATIGVTTQTALTSSSTSAIQITTEEDDTTYYSGAAQYFIPDAENVKAQEDVSSKYIELAYDSTVSNQKKLTFTLDGVDISGSTIVRVSENGPYTMTLVAEAGYILPSSIADENITVGEGQTKPTCTLSTVGSSDSAAQLTISNITADATIALEGVLKAPTVTTSGNINKTYDGKNIMLSVTPSHEASGVTYTYQWSRGNDTISGATSASYTLTAPGVTSEEGDTYTCTVTATDGSGRTATATATITVQITAADIEGITVTAYNGSYDGKAHSVEAEVPDGFKIQYAENENGDYSDTAPIFTDAGEHTVYWQVTATSGSNYKTANSSVVVTIAKATQAMSYATTKMDKYIGDEAFTNELTETTVFGAVTYVSSDSAVATVDAQSGEVTIVGTGMATITAKAAGDEANYDEATASYTLTVSRRSSGGSSGGSGSSSYTVTVDSGKNGSITVSPKSASKGTTVTVTVKPNSGYELDDLTVTDKNGDTVKLTRKSDTQYTFTMPTSKVTVEASFTEIEEQPEISFVDVSASAYYYDAVAWAVENGITSGTSATTFSPDTACTRAQAVTFLWRAAGSPAPKSSVNPFADVPSSAYYYDAVLWAVEQGITAGTSAATFSPDATCTRGQIVTFLHRADGTAATGSNPFTDVADNAYYVDAVKWAVAESVTAGTSATTFSPDASCTRAQIVTFLYRAYA